MNDSLLIQADSFYSQNFLIYLQNIYLNQKIREKHQSKERFKFPYVTEKVQFYDDFEVRFKELKG